MTDTRKQFQEAMSENDYGVSNFVVVNGKYQWPQTEEAYQVWQACQSLNDKRIHKLLAVIHDLRASLAQINRLPIPDSGFCYAIAKEVLATNPENVELVEVGKVKEVGGSLFACQYSPDNGLRIGDILLTIKTKGQNNAANS